MERRAVNPSSWSVNDPRQRGPAQLHTTDMDTLLQHFPMVNERFEGDGERFATTLLGVASLAAPDLVVALEATEVD
jgi:hypothetical protein